MVYHKKMHSGNYQVGKSILSIYQILKEVDNILSVKNGDQGMWQCVNGEEIEVLLFSN